MSSYRCGAQRRMRAGTLDHPVERVREHKAKLSRVAVESVDLWPPVQVGLKGEQRGERFPPPQVRGKTLRRLTLVIILCKELTRTK